MTLPVPRTINNDVYASMHQQWTELRRQHEANGTPVPSVGDVLGRTMLSFILPTLREYVKKKATKNQDIKPMLKTFFDDLEVELMNPRSEICGPIVDAVSRSSSIAAGSNVTNNSASIASSSSSSSLTKSVGKKRKESSPTDAKQESSSDAAAAAAAAASNGATFDSAVSPPPTSKLKYSPNSSRTVSDAGVVVKRENDGVDKTVEREDSRDVAVVDSHSTNSLTKSTSLVPKSELSMQQRAASIASTSPTTTASTSLTSNALPPVLQQIPLAPPGSSGIADSVLYA